MSLRILPLSGSADAICPAALATQSPQMPHQGQDKTRTAAWLASAEDEANIAAILSCREVAP
jgi:hypothetical protein